MERRLLGGWRMKTYLGTQLKLNVELLSTWFILCKMHFGPLMDMITPLRSVLAKFLRCFTALQTTTSRNYSSCKMQMVFYQVLRTLSVWRNYTAMILLRSCLFSQLKRHLYSLCKGCIIVISGSTLPTAWRLFQTMYEDRQNQAQVKVLGFAHSYLS